MERIKQIKDQIESRRNQNLYKVTWVAKQATQTTTCYVVADSLAEAASMIEKRESAVHPIILSVSIEASGDTVINVNHVSPKLYY